MWLQEDFHKCWYFKFKYLLNAIMLNNINCVIQITVHFFLYIISIRSSFIVRQISMKIDNDDSWHCKNAPQSVTVNRNNCSIWDSSPDSEYLEDILIMWMCDVHSQTQVIWLFFFAERKTVNPNAYLDMLENYPCPQPEGGTNIFQQDGAFLHFSNITWQLLNAKFSYR
jgi:hypothetical protein